MLLASDSGILSRSSDLKDNLDLILLLSVDMIIAAKLLLETSVLVFR